MRATTASSTQTAGMKERKQDKKRSSRTSQLGQLQTKHNSLAAHPIDCQMGFIHQQIAFQVKNFLAFVQSFIMRQPKTSKFDLYIQQTLLLPIQLPLHFLYLSLSYTHFMDGRPTQRGLFANFKAYIYFLTIVNLTAPSYCQNFRKQKRQE